jgi:hypothetical protein
MTIKKNTVYTFDSFMVQFSPSFMGYFWSQGDFLTADNSWQEDGLVFSLDMALDSKFEMHQREVFNILDLLGELGGVLEVITIIFFFIAAPVAEHSFYMQLFDQLYLAKTKNRTILPNNHI